jgi:hypothetical protein
MPCRLPAEAIRASGCGYERHVLLLTGTEPPQDRAAALRWCPSAVIKTVGGHTNHSRWCYYTYFLDEGNAKTNGLAVFMMLFDETS